MEDYPQRATIFEKLQAVARGILLYKKFLEFNKLQATARKLKASNTTADYLTIYKTYLCNYYVKLCIWYRAYLRYTYVTRVNLIVPEVSGDI